MTKTLNIQVAEGEVATGFIIFSIIKVKVLVVIMAIKYFYKKTKNTSIWLS